MSFLPYAKAPPAAWITSVGGSSLLHGAIVALLLTSSIALLPPPIITQPHAPDFEITLEILDVTIIESPQDIKQDSLIPDGAVALVPVDGTTDLLAQSEDLLPPVEDTVEPLQAETSPEIAQPTIPPDVQGPVLQPPLSVIEPKAQEDIIAIDDISPIDNTEISPLAQIVAPSVQADSDVVALLPQVQPEDAIITIPPVDDTMVPAVLLPETGPTPAAIEPNVIKPAAVVTDEVGEAEAQTESNAPQVLANPDVNTALIGTLLRRIRATPAPQCTLALPRRAGPDGVGVSFIGSQTNVLDTFATRIFDGLSPPPVQTREIIDPRQCALLDAVRQIADYPAGRIGLSLEDATLQSGETLKGRVIGAGGLFVTLLLIDDNGIVQDMSRFTTLQGNDPVFDAPIARSGPARATRQVLVVLGSPDRLIDVSAQIGLGAEAVFAALPPQTLETILFGLATFDVR